MDKFLGHGSAFWVGIEAIAVCVYSVAFTVTLWFLYKQVRTAAKGFQLSAIQRMQQLVDDFRDDRHKLFRTFPLEIAVADDQFSKHPPSRRSLSRTIEGHLLRVPITDEQKGLVAALNDDQRQLARRVIGRLNDLGELIEDGLVDRPVFLGKYHVMLIQCCHMVEAFRQEEESLRGGNYGHRLLRMRHWAITYNDIYPKHRQMPITISNGTDRRLIYRSPPPIFSKRIAWAIRRWLS